MITTVGKLKEKLSKFHNDKMKVRILDLSNDSGETGVYEIKSIEENNLVKTNNEKEETVLTINFEQF